MHKLGLFEFFSQVAGVLNAILITSVSGFKWKFTLCKLVFSLAFLKH